MTVPAGSTYVIGSILLGNPSAGTVGAVTVTITKSGGSAVVLVLQHPMPVNSLIEMLVGRGTLNLQAGDVLTFTAVADNSVTVSVSYVEDVAS
jgi:hypothetical protein